MTHSTPARTTSTRRRRSTMVGAFLVAAAVVGMLMSQSSSPSDAHSPAPSSITAQTPVDTPQADHRPAGLGEDGDVPDGVTIFDEDVAAVARLDPDLLRALQEAATGASRSGTTFYVNSGWRSRAYQERLLSQAISRYGSKARAARWVATADTSPHVSGDAVDLGGADATTWLSQHGASYGLCQIYRNEPWHYELRPSAIRHGCPPRYADPTHDPRMQK